MSPLATLLLQKNAVQISLTPPFSWTSGYKSPVYCDNRLLTGYPETRTQIVDAFVEKIQKNFPETEAIAGVATGSIAWGALVAEKMRLPFVFVRSEAKAHGTKKQIEGAYELGKNMLVIEDLLSTGRSSIAAAEVLVRESRAHILGILAIMSWEIPALAEARKQHSYPITSLTEFSEILSVAESEHRFSPEEIAIILQFQKNPAAWGDTVGLS